MDQYVSKYTAEAWGVSFVNERESPSSLDGKQQADA